MQYWTKHEGARTIWRTVCLEGKKAERASTKKQRSEHLEGTGKGSPGEHPWGEGWMLLCRKHHPCSSWDPEASLRYQCIPETWASSHNKSIKKAVSLKQPEIPALWPEKAKAWSQAIPKDQKEAFWLKFWRLSGWSCSRNKSQFSPLFKS